MRILAYKGTSKISWLIKRFTRSEYSHIAVEMSDGTVYEAWYNGGVVKRKDYNYGHTPGTVIDAFTILGEIDEDVVRDMAEAELGKKYSFRNVVRFVSRVRARKDDEWFCSHFGLYLSYWGGVSLLSTITDFEEMNPRDVLLSPLLKYDIRLICMG